MRTVLSAQERARKPATLLDNRGPAIAEERESIPSQRMNKEYGKTSDYRIARDRPDILAEMTAGKFPSVRAAARMAMVCITCAWFTPNTITI